MSKAVAGLVCYVFLFFLHEYLFTVTVVHMVWYGRLFRMSESDYCFALALRVCRYTGSVVREREKLDMRIGTRGAALPVEMELTAVAHSMKGPVEVQNKDAHYCEWGRTLRY